MDTSPIFEHFHSRGVDSFLKPGWLGLIIRLENFTSFALNPILHGLFSIPYYMGGVWYTPPVDYCSLLIGGRPKWTNFSWHHYFKHLKGPGHVNFWKFFKNFKNFRRRMILVKIWQKKWKLKNFELQTCLIPQMKAENM